MKKVILVLALAGCAQQLTKSGVTSEQASADTAQCRQEAALATAPIYDTIQRTIRQNELITSCLQMRGYR